MLEAKIHSAKVQDREGIKILLDLAPDHLPRLSHLWMDAGYTGEGMGAEGTGMDGTDSATRSEAVPEEVMIRWVR